MLDGELLHIEMLELINDDEVKKAGSKVIELADKEGWSGALLYLVARELARFLAEQGIKDLGIDGENISSN